MTEKTGPIEVTFSHEKPASWPPLHAAQVGQEQTLCGIKITGEWDYDGGCGPSDVECLRCRRVLGLPKRIATELLGQVNKVHDDWIDLKAAHAPPQEIETAYVKLRAISVEFRAAGGMGAVMQEARQ